MRDRWLRADIIELIMADHRRIRRLCRALDDAVRWERDSGPGWMPPDVGTAGQAAG